MGYITAVASAITWRARSESEAKSITRQLLEGLFVIYAEGFAHWDLKPEMRPHPVALVRATNLQRARISL